MTNSGPNRGIRPAGASGRRPGGRVVGRDRGHVAAAPAPVPLRVTGNAVSANFFRRSVRLGRPEGGESAAPPARRSAGLPPPGSKTPGRRPRACADGRLDRNIIIIKSYTPPEKVRAAAVFWHLAAPPSVFRCCAVVSLPLVCPRTAPPAMISRMSCGRGAGREWRIERFLPRPCPRVSDHSPPQGMGRCAGLSPPYDFEHLPAANRVVPRGGQRVRPDVLLRVHGGDGGVRRGGQACGRVRSTLGAAGGVGPGVSGTA